MRVCGFVCASVQANPTRPHHPSAGHHHHLLLSPSHLWVFIQSIPMKRPRMCLRLCCVVLCFLNSCLRFRHTWPTTRAAAPFPCALSCVSPTPATAPGNPPTRSLASEPHTPSTNGPSDIRAAAVVVFCCCCCCLLLLFVCCCLLGTYGSMRQREQDGESFTSIAVFEVTQRALAEAALAPDSQTPAIRLFLSFLADPHVPSTHQPIPSSFFCFHQPKPTEGRWPSTQFFFFFVFCFCLFVLAGRETRRG